MKLFRLYLREADGAPTGADAPATPTAAPGTTGTQPVAKDKLSMSQDEADKKIDAITVNFKKSIDALVMDLGKLPVIATNAQAKTRLEYLMGNLTKFKETFEEGGSNYQAIMSAMQAGGKATGAAGLGK